jgi:Flp pilus assembly protein TadG
MNTHHRRQSRAGNVLVLTALMMVFMFGILAFAIDLGYLNVIRTELQKSADAAAMAGAWDLMETNGAWVNTRASARMAAADATARQYAGLNPVARSSPALGAQDIGIGYLSNPSDPNAQMSFTDPSRFNAVRVDVRRTSDQNGLIPLFFARVIGTNTASSQAQATAAFVNDFRGFTAPPNGNLGFLPFALDQETWDTLWANGTDDWTWDPESRQVTAGPDGILEVNLFPQGTGSPGNRGTVDIGSNNNSTADLARQILEGVSEADLAYHGGSLELDENGELPLNGDTGISAGVKDELASIKGRPVVIPIFREVSGNGNNAWYTIVGFEGACIVEVKLTGSMNSKRVMIQQAPVEILGGIPANGGGSTPKSELIYSPVWLVR